MTLSPNSFDDLLPTGVAAEVVAGVADRASALMALCRKVRMPTRSEIVPVVSSAPIAGFVDAATGLKPEGEVDWTPLTLTAGEIGVIVGLPDAFISDSQFPVWASVRDEIVAAFTKVFEQAALYGTNAPPAWPTGGITAAAYATSVSGTDALDALDKAMSALEQAGVVPTGILGGAALRAALRQQTVTILQPFDAAPASIYGVPIQFSTNWDDTKGLALVGGFDADVLVGIRQDLSWSITDTGVITDATGKVLVNAYQQDYTLLRCYWRLALQVAMPVGPAGTAVKPLALATIPPLGARKGGAAKE
jgi:HK97 family phage major capsid protein